MKQPFNEIQKTIAEHYREIKNNLYIEKCICEESPYICNDDRIEFLERLISSYDSLFPWLHEE